MLPLLPVLMRAPLASSPRSPPNDFLPRDRALAFSRSHHARGAHLVKIVCRPCCFSSPRVFSDQAAMLPVLPVLMRAPLACSSSFTLNQ